MIFIPTNVPSLKNSKVIIGVGRTCPCCKKKPTRVLISSKSVRKWKKETDKYWKQYREEFLEMIREVEAPYRITFKFIRKTRHKFDYTNALDTVQDEMVHQGWLEEDNATVIRPIIRPFKYDKFRPGVFIGVKI